MFPRPIRRCDVSGEEIGCSYCQGWGTVSIPVPVGTPGFDSYILYRHESCTACGGGGVDRSRSHGIPSVPVVAVGEDGSR